MASILNKYKKDSSKLLLDKYKESTQKPSVLKEERVSKTTNPSFELSSSNVENVLPDLTDKDGKVISEEADVFTKILKTGASVGSDVLYGAGKGVEGVVDAVATVVSQFDSSGNVEDFIKKNYTEELLGGMQEKAHKDSFYKEDSVLSQVFQSVGQMLPSIGLSAINPAIGLTAFGVSAGGTSAEQAYLEGASDLEALAYGTVSGLVETGIEMISGGLGGLGKGAIQKVAPTLATKMAKSTTTKVLVNMAGEGLEEMASEVLNPLMKNIYDKESLGEYQNEEFVSNVLEAGLSGALCSAVLMGGNVVITQKNQRIAQDIQDLQEEMLRQTELGNMEQANDLANEIQNKTKEFEESISKKDIEKQEILKSSLQDRLTNLEVEKERKVLNKLRKESLNDKSRADLESKLSNLENYTSERLQKMDSKKRQEYITNNAQNYKFTQKGTLKKEYVNLDSKTKAKQDYTSQALQKINKLNNNKLGLEFVDNDEYNGKIVGNTIYLNKNNLEKDNWKQLTIKTLGHELTHSQENKGVYKKFKEIISSLKNKEEYTKRLLAKKTLYDNSNLEGLEIYRNMTEEQQLEYIDQEVVADYVGEALSDERTLNRLVQEDRNLIEKMLDFFKNIKEKFSKKSKAEKEFLKQYAKEIDTIVDTFTALLQAPKDLTIKKEKYDLKEDSLGNKLSKEQIEFFKDSKVVDEEGRLLPMYHGTQRMDRVGYYFDPKRATSGPMAFFTDNKEIATDYSINKKDTSLYNEYNSYYDWFKLKGTNINIAKAWNIIPLYKKQKLKEMAFHITTNEDTDTIIYDAKNKNGIGNFEYHLTENNGNVFKALIEEWLNSGTLFNQEEKFMDVLDILGVKEQFEFDSPEKIKSGIYEVYLNITKPFYTENLDNNFVNEIEKITPKYNEDELIFGSGADMWDKSNPYNKVNFINRLKSDLKDGTSLAWTSIPDFVTNYLKEKGYDGILDKGGKMGGEVHLVAIPFYSNQIKLTTNKTPTKTSDDIRYSLKEETQDIKLDTQRDVEYLSKIAENLIFNRTKINNREFNSLIPSLDDYKESLQTEFRKILEGTNRGKTTRNSSLIKLLKTKVDGDFTLYDIIRIAELGERTEQPKSLPDQKLLINFLRVKGKINEFYYHLNPINLINNNFLPTYLKNIKEKANAVGNPISFVVDKAYNGSKTIGGWYNTLSKEIFTVVNTGWNVVKVVNHEIFHSMLGYSQDTFNISSKFMKDVEDLLISKGDYTQALESIALTKSYANLRKSPFRYDRTGGFTFANHQNSQLEEFCCEVIAGDFKSDLQELHDLREKFIKDYEQYFIQDNVEGNVDRTSLKPFDYDNFERVNFDVEQTISKVKTKIEINEKTFKQKLKHNATAFKNSFIDSSTAYLDAIEFLGGDRKQAEIKMNTIRAFKNRSDYALQNGVRSLNGKDTLTKPFDDIFHNWINEKFDQNSNPEKYDELKRKFFDYLLHHHNIDRMNILREISLIDIINSEILEDEEKENITKFIKDKEKELGKPITYFETSYIKHLISKGHYDLFEADFRENASVFGKYTRLNAFSKNDKKFLKKVAPSIYKILEENTNISESQVEELIKEFVPTIDINDFNITDSFVLNSKQRYKIVEKTTGKVIASYDTREKAIAEIEEKITNYYTRLVKRKLRNSLTQVSTEDSKLTIARYEKEYPEFKEHAKDVWKLSKSLMKLRLNGGLITQELYDELNKRYPHYVPTNREISTNLGKGSTGAGGGTSVSTGIKNAKGSDIVIEPIDVVFARQIRNTYNNIAVNMMANELYDAKINFTQQDVTRVKLKEEVIIRRNIDEITDDSKNLLGEKGNVVTFYKDGKAISMAVDEQIAEGFKAINSFTGYSSENVILNWVGKVNKGFKGIVTEYNPFFLIRNFVRDIQDALLYSKNGTQQLLKNLPSAIKGIMGNSELWQQYCAMGGLYSSIFDYNNGTVTSKELNKFEKTKIKKGINYIKNKVARANMIVEQSVRFSEFISSLENGKSVNEAFYDAQEITVNFGKSGVTTKKLNATLVPFLNAQVQGFCKITRTIFSKKTLNQWASLFLRALLIGMMPSLLNYLLYFDDEEYQGLSDYYKNNNYLIKIGDKFVKIPKGRLITVLSTALINFVELSRGEKDAFEGYADTVVQAVSPVNDFRTILSPINDVKTNTTWYGGQIESSKFSNIKPSNRFDDSTSIIAKGLGKVFNYSPKKIDYLLDQYSGVIGDILIPATNSDSKTNFFTFVTSNLTVDSVYKTKYYQDFNNKLTKLQYLKSEGDAIATLQVKYMNKVKSKVAELYDEQRKIEEDKSLSAKDKKEQLKTIQLLINNMYNTAYKNVDALGSNLKNLPLTEDSLEDDYYYGLYLTFGAETALSLHSTKLYEKAKNLVDNSTLTYDDFLLTYFDCKGMKKSEAIQYIQNLPMTKNNKQKLLDSLF